MGEPLDDKALGHAARGFTNENGKVVRQGICKFLGMQPWTPHDLRRTSASLARGLGIPKWKISQCLDHRSRDEEEAPVVTDAYVHSEFDGEKKDVLDAVAAASDHWAPARNPTAGPKAQAGRLTRVRTSCISVNGRLKRKLPLG